MRINYITTKKCELIGNKLYLVPEKVLIAEVKLKNVEHIDLYYVTKHDKMYRWLNAHKKRATSFQKTGNDIYNYDGVFVCQHCNRPIITLYEEYLLNYAIFVKCKCGIVYDNRRVRKI